MAFLCNSLSIPNSNELPRPWDSMIRLTCCEMSVCAGKHTFVGGLSPPFPGCLAHNRLIRYWP
jgi:hypothetical protein